MTRQRPWLKGMATVAALAVAVMVVWVSPVSAAFTPTKGAIKKIARKVAKKQANKVKNQLQPQISANAAAIAGLAGASGVLSSFKNGPEDVPSGIDQIGSLAVPAGSYALFAKLVVADVDPSFGTGTYCELRVGLTAVDASEGYVEFSADGGNRSAVTISLMAATTVGSPSTVSVWCDDFATADEWSNLKIMAIKAPSASTVASAAPSRAADTDR